MGDGQGHLTRFFVYATKGNVPDYVTAVDPASGTRRDYQLVTDFVGSLRLVIDSEDGTIVQRMDYDEFGRVTYDYSASGWEPLPFGFAGGLYDRDTGLVRFGARDYDAETGRWTAKDPILFNGGQANLYVYCDNDPVNCIDVNGMDTQVLFVNRGGLQGLVGQHVALLIGSGRNAFLWDPGGGFGNRRGSADQLQDAFARHHFATNPDVTEVVAVPLGTGADEDALILLRAAVIEDIALSLLEPLLGDQAPYSNVPAGLCSAASSAAIGYPSILVPTLFQGSLSTFR